MECDVIVIGAGVSGLTVASELQRAGRDVHILEATSRIGGRIYTIRPCMSELPIELGAEFVHGRPPEIWNWIRTASLSTYEHEARALHIDHKRIIHSQDVGTIADKVLSKMARSSRRRDESFEDYLRHSRISSDARKWSRIHIEGFNAARKDWISATSLTKDSDAAKAIDGDRTFRIVNGYDAVPEAILRSIREPQMRLHLSCVVEVVKWRRHRVDVHYRSALDGESLHMRCRQLVVTIPLGVLQAIGGNRPDRGLIQFEPSPDRVLKAARVLKCGHVYRVTFRFSNAFWESDGEYKRVGFIVSRDKNFFTWWTTSPVATPMLTGWMAGSSADRFRHENEFEIAREAMNSLFRIFRRKVPRPEAFYFHNWREDPFFRGAYSYVPVNGIRARKALSSPVEETLFFSGEATHTNGFSGTVHGAIASGIQTANTMVDCDRRCL